MLSKSKAASCLICFQPCQRLLERGLAGSNNDSLLKNIG
jgi:hypothetical protein